jgi:EpsI family protein
MTSRVVVLLACLVLAAGAVSRADRQEAVPLRASLDDLPLTLAQWSGTVDPPPSQEVLDVLKADDYLGRTYRIGREAVVGLYIGYWKSQRQGDTIHSPLNCLPGSGWEPISHQIMSVPDARGGNGSIPINRYVIQKGMDHQLVLYWYQSHGRVVASEYWSKFYLVTDAVRTNHSDGAIVRVTAPILGDGPEAEQRAESQALSFVRVLLPQLGGFLPA